MEDIPVLRRIIETIDEYGEVGEEVEDDEDGLTPLLAAAATYDADGNVPPSARSLLELPAIYDMR
jgi:hypothetical protein